MTIVSAIVTVSQGQSEASRELLACNDAPWTEAEHTEYASSGGRRSDSASRRSRDHSRGHIIAAAGRQTAARSAAN